MYPNALTVWVERGFSRREIATRMLRAMPSLVLIGTPKMPLPGAKALVALPSFEEPGAIQAANRLIAEHDVHILWTQRSACFDLSGLACTVHSAATPEVIDLVDDKAKFSEWLGDDPVRADAIEVTGVGAIAEEYDRRRTQGRETCVKPVIGVNGSGYWHLTESPEAASLLDEPEERQIHPDVYLKALSLQEDDEEPTRMLVMDYLPGPEVSIDLLCWQGKPLIHAARTKLEGDRQLIQSEHTMLEHAYSVAGRLALHGIVSMQYRLDIHQNWRMLEVNPRPAGGSIHSEDAGFGIITGWTRLITGMAEPGDVVQYDGEATLAFQRVACPS